MPEKVCVFKIGVAGETLYTLFQVFLVIEGDRLLHLQAFSPTE